MIDVNRFLEYLRRIPATIGFGVQSPFAYNFIRKVVCDCNHGILRGIKANLWLRPSVRKGDIFSFLLRLSRYANSGRLYVSSELYPAFYLDAVALGNEQIVFEYNPSNYATIVIISTLFVSVDSLLGSLSEDAILIVMDIRKDKHSELYWDKIVNDCRTGVSFDLYDIGVVSFNKKMHKRLYFCNL